MDPPAPPTRLYPRGAYLCVTSQISPSTLLICKTITVVTTTSIMVQVLWLKQTDQAGVFRHSFKSDVLVSSIIGEVVVTEKGKTVVLGMSEMARLAFLVKKVENEERVEQMDSEDSDKKMVSDDMKTCESSHEWEILNKQTTTTDTEPCIVEMVSTKVMLEQLDATMNLVGRNMFISFRCLEDMMTYTEQVEEEETFLTRMRQKKRISANLSKTIQNDTPVVPDREGDIRDISVLHMEVEVIEPVEQMRENQYDLVRDILEEMLDKLWEDLDTVDKLSEEKDPWVPQSEIKKDVQQFEKVEIEVTANLQIVVVEDNLLDEMVSTPNNMGEEENSPTKHLEKTFETSDLIKRMKRPNYLGSSINNYENYDPVFRSLRGGNPAEKVTERPQIVVDDVSSKDEMVSTSNTVGAKEKPHVEHVEKDDKNSDSNKRIKRPLAVSNMNNNMNDHPSYSRRVRGGENSQVKKVRIRKASRCLSCEPCMRADCGLCSRCQDMTKYGGRGRLKKACQERICQNMEVAPGTKL